MTDKIWKPKSNTEGTEEILAKVNAGAIRRDKLEGGKPNFVSNFRRICPQHINMERWFHVVPQHFGIGPSNRSLGCLRLNEISKCPACELGFSLLKGSEDDKKEGKKILPSWRFMMNVMLLNQDGTLANQQPHVLTVGKQLFGLIEEIVREEGDITDIEDGRSINIKRKGTEWNDTEYMVKEAKSASPFPGELDLLDEIYDLTEIVEFVDAPTMLDIIQGKGATMLPGGNPWDDDSTPADSKASPEKKATLPAGGFEDEAEEQEKGEETTAETAPIETETTEAKEALARLSEHLADNGKEKPKRKRAKAKAE